MAGGLGGGAQPGQIQGSDTSNAMFGTQMSIQDMTNRYNQLGLGGSGAKPTGPAIGATAGVPGSGFTPTAGGTPATPGTAATPTGGLGSTPTPGTSASGPTAYMMDIGAAPSLTGGIPREFQGALGEGQFQDLSETTSAAVGAQQAKGQVASGIGSLIGGI
jgi:hypothetical protein